MNREWKATAGGRKDGSFRSARISLFELWVLTISATFIATPVHSIHKADSLEEETKTVPAAALDQSLSSMITVVSSKPRQGPEQLFWQLSSAVSEKIIRLKSGAAWCAVTEESSLNVVCVCVCSGLLVSKCVSMCLRVVVFVTDRPPWRTDSCLSNLLWESMLSVE